MHYNNVLDRLRTILAYEDKRFGRVLCDGLDAHFTKRHMPPHEYVPWDTVVNSINSYLNSWLVTNSYNKDFPEPITAARSVLTTIDDEQYMESWLRDIAKYYAPTACQVFLYEGGH